MAQSIRVSDEMYALAQRTGTALDRSLAQQFEYWARLGAAIDAAGITSSQAMSLLEAGKPVDVLIAVATGHADNSGDARIRRRNEQLEADVAAGRRSAASLLIFSAEAVSASTVSKAPYPENVLDGGGGW
jgi:hypothetical protein